jgi:predicted Zn-dependent peptidase
VALSVLSEILSAGKSSRLHRALIHDHPLAHEVHAYNMELKDPGIFLFLALGNPDTTAETMEAALIEQIDRIKQSPVTAEELQKVKASTQRDFVQMMEGASGLSDLFGSYLIRGDLTPLQNYEANLDKITPKTIQEVANRYFDHTLSTTVILRKSDG